MSLALNDRNRLLFIQSQTLPPSMHHKWKEICMKNNEWNFLGYQLPKKSPIEWMDYSMFSISLATNFGDLRLMLIYGQSLHLILVSTL